MKEIVSSAIDVRVGAHPHRPSGRAPVGAPGAPGGTAPGGAPARAGAGASAVEADDDALVNWTEVQDIELAIVRRMREYMSGQHPSVFHGDGFEFAGLRDWEPGDRLTSIDWAQSTLTNFAPIVTREFEQQSTARLVIVADASSSTRCGAAGAPIARTIARTVGTLALAGAFFQDQVGLITFDRSSRHLTVRPRVGRNHAIHCLDAYQALVHGSGHAAEPHRIDDSIAGLIRRTSLVPVVSDFLFDGYEELLDELLALNATHDVFVVLIDSRDAFALPALSAGWIEVADVETGRTRLVSAADLERMGDAVAAWQDGVEQRAGELGLEVLPVGPPPARVQEQGVALLADRRLRKR